MRTLSLTFTFLMATGLLALGTNASADTLTGTLRQPLRESSHSVDVRVKHGVATYTVKRTFANLGTRHEEAQLRIRLPFGASVTGLRIRGKSKWHRGELMHVDSARSLYRELTGMGPHLPRDPALLQWVWADQAHLHLFPIAPQSASTVEYTLTVPTRYRDGEYILFYPMASGAKNLTSPVIRFVGSRKYTRMVFDGTPTTQGEPNVGANQLATSSLLEGLDPMGSHKVNSITVAREDEVSSFRVKADIKHTYRGDLRVVLVSPIGDRYPLHENEGGGSNDLRIDKEHSLRQVKSAKGTWSLIVSDSQGLDSGTLESWSLDLVTVKKTKITARAGDTPMVIPDAPSDEGVSDMHTMKVSAEPIRVVSGRLGRVDVIKGKNFQRFELDVAKDVGVIPRYISVVFVVDLSRSLANERDCLGSV